MSYAAAIQNLSSLIPELFSAPASTGPASPDGPNSSAPTRRKFSLTEIGILSAALGNPHTQFPSVLIAGTNGKGSTASTLASIARSAGLRVGLYTSPHLDRVNERIKILTPQNSASGFSNPDIPDDTFATLYFRVHDAAQQLVLDGALQTLPSYFELLTALAFLYFAESNVDLAVLEVGMGGRLDATNLVTPILSVITDISLDHQEWLGATIAEITREKAGILRPNGALITLPQHPQANQAMGEVAAELNVRGIPATDYMPQINASPTEPYEIQVLGEPILVDSPLKGAHQHRNLALAIATAVELATSHSFTITPAAIAQGIRQTHWPARLENIHLTNQPEFLLDVAHNPAGAWALRSALSSAEPATPQVLIFSCLRDKPLREMTQILFPLFDHVILAPIHSPRATDLAELQSAAEATGAPSTTASSVSEAIDLARALNPRRIVISGSLYLVGEARTLLLTEKLAGKA